MGRQDEIVKERVRKIKELREQGINPYATKYEVKNTSSELQSKYGKLNPNARANETARLAGRVMSIRDIGKIIFLVVNDGHGKIQAILQDSETPAKLMEFFKKYIDSGDFIGIEGQIFRTQRGELSIVIHSGELLTKSVYPLPDKWAGLTDEEEKLRKR